MASRYALEVTLSSAKDLKNVNWRHGPTSPYAVLWVDPSDKCSTRVDHEGDTSPAWDQALAILLSPGPIEDQTLYIDVVHAGSEEDTKPLIGSARIKLRDILDEAGLGVPLGRSLLPKRPSDRLHGKIELEVCVRETRFRAPPYGVPPATREYAPPAYGIPYAPLQPNPHYTTVPPAGGYANVPYSAYNEPPPQHRYGGEPPPAYGQHRQQEEEESNFEGMWTALAVGVGVGVGGSGWGRWLSLDSPSQRGWTPRTARTSMKRRKGWRRSSAMTRMICGEPGLVLLFCMKFRFLF